MIFFRLKRRVMVNYGANNTAQILCGVLENVGGQFAL